MDLEGLQIPAVFFLVGIATGFVVGILHNLGSRTLDAFS